MLGEIPWNRVPRRLLARHIQKEDVMPTVSPQILPILMLFASNVFMTFAWYGHLKFKAYPLPLVIMASWGIAFFRILAGGAGQPLGQRGVFGSPTQDHAGGDHAGRVRLLLGAVLEGAAGLESRAGLFPDRCRRVFDLPQMGVISTQSVFKRNMPSDLIRGYRFARKKRVKRESAALPGDVGMAKAN
jgi:hypothetical protein